MEAGRGRRAPGGLGRPRVGGAAARRRRGHATSGSSSGSRRAPGARCRHTPPDRTDPPTRRERVIENLARRDWVLVDHEWDMDHLWLLRPGDWHALWVSWVGGDHVGWYVNLQRPLRRTALGFEAMDMMLDVVVEPDLTWRWKDEDEFADLLDRGLIDRATSDRVRREGEAVVDLVERRAAPFSEPWPGVAPRPGLAAPELPAGWDVVPLLRRPRGTPSGVVPYAACRTLRTWRVAGLSCSVVSSLSMPDLVLRDVVVDGMLVDVRASGGAIASIDRRLAGAPGRRRDRRPAGRAHPRPARPPHPPHGPGGRRALAVRRAAVRRRRCRVRRRHRAGPPGPRRRASGCGPSATTSRWPARSTAGGSTRSSPSDRCASSTGRAAPGSSTRPALEPPASTATSTSRESSGTATGASPGASWVSTAGCATGCRSSRRPTSPSSVAAWPPTASPGSPTSRRRPARRPRPASPRPRPTARCPST